MLKSNTELMKELKEIQQLINFAQNREDNNSTSTYSFIDKNEVVTDYDYEKTRKELDDMQKEERKIKNLLAISNATTLVQGFDITIAEALVYLGQLSQNKAHLTKLATREKIVREESRYSSNTMYTKANYDIAKAQADLAQTHKLIAKLQMAIDLTNLTNKIEC